MLHCINRFKLLLLEDNEWHILHEIDVRHGEIHKWEIRLKSNTNHIYLIIYNSITDV